MRIYELLDTNKSIGVIDIYNQANTFIKTIKKQDFKNNANLLIKEIDSWQIANITKDKIIIGIKIK
jgi:hypothetical protein